MDGPVPLIIVVVLALTRALRIVGDWPCMGSSSFSRKGVKGGRPPSTLYGHLIGWMFLGRDGVKELNSIT